MCVLRLSWVLLLAPSLAAETLGADTRLRSVVRGNKGVATVVEEKWGTLGGSKLFFHEAGEENKPTVLLLHGAAFSSQTWEDIGTIQRLGNEGFRVYAVDIPNAGHSKSGHSTMDRSKMLPELVKELKLPAKFAVVSPSMSGGVAVPYLLDKEGAGRVAAFIPVAPVSTSLLPNDQKLSVPTLMVRGEKDHKLGTESFKQIREAVAPDVLEEYVVKGGGHPCYLDDPDGFNDRLVSFLKEKLM